MPRRASGPRMRAATQAVLTSVTRGLVFDVGVKFNIESNGGILNVSPKNDRASPNVKTASARVRGAFSGAHRKEDAAPCAFKLPGLLCLADQFSAFSA